MKHISLIFLLLLAISFADQCHKQIIRLAVGDQFSLTDEKTLRENGYSVKELNDDEFGPVMKEPRENAFMSRGISIERKADKINVQLYIHNGEIRTIFDFQKGKGASALVNELFLDI